MQRSHQRARQTIVRMPALLPRFDAFAVPIPEIGGKLAHTGIEEVGVLEHLVVEIILGGEAQRVGLDPHVDILRDENDAAPGMGARKLHHDGDNVVVGLAARERRWQRHRNRFGLQEQTPGRGAARFLGQRNPLHDRAVRRLRGDELIQKTRCLTRIARDFGHAFLVRVELLKREHRQVDVVLFEVEHARRIVHQHIGVEHEQLGSGRRAGLGGLAGREKMD